MKGKCPICGSKKIKYVREIGDLMSFYRKDIICEKCGRIKYDFIRELKEQGEANGKKV